MPTTTTPPLALSTRLLLSALLVFAASSGCGNGAPGGLANDDNDNAGDATEIGAITAVDFTGYDQCAHVDSAASLELLLYDHDDSEIPATSGFDLEADDFEFGKTTLYAVPDVDCTSDDVLCPGDLSCDSSPDGVDRCQARTGLSAASAPNFIGAQPDSQAFGVAVADVGRWEGRYHSNFQGLYEFDESGQNRELAHPVDNNVAVDPGGHRINALRDLAGEWGRLSDALDEDGRGAYFGYWLFGGPSGEVVPELTNGGWTQDPAAASNVIDQHQFREGQAGVYNSMIRIIQDYYEGASEVSGVEDKHLLFLVAGYDERRDNTVDEVIEFAGMSDVRVSVAQVDGEIPVPAHLRDDERYYRDQYDSPCTSSDQCANYEACREPTPYTDSANTDDPGDIVWPDPEFHTPGNRYCLPDYDENGRVGPIEEYRRLACETGGNYAYVPEVGHTAIGEPMIGLLWASEAAWEIDIALGHNPSSADASLLETVMNVADEPLLSMELGDGTDPDRRRALFGAD